MSQALRRAVAGLASGLLMVVAGALTARAELAQSKTTQPGTTTFEVLLSEAGLVLDKSDDLVDDAAPQTDLYAFQKALRHRELPLKIYYAIRPLARMKIDYEDPHSNAPEPNHIFPMVFQALIGRLARHGASPSRVYSPEQAKALFNADWAAASLFDAEPALNSSFRSALLVAIHKNARADAYTLFLFDDPEPIKSAIDTVLGSLHFAEPPK